MMAEPARHFTVAELAAHWGVTTTHVYNLTRGHELGCLRFGKAIRITIEQVQVYEESISCPGTSKPAPTTDSSEPEADDGTYTGLRIVEVKARARGRETRIAPSDS